MGGKTKSNETTHQSATNSVTPTGIQPYQDAYKSGYDNLQGIYNQRISQPLNLKDIPGFTQGFDPVVQNQMSRGISNIKDQQAAGDQALSDSLTQAGTGDNSSLLGVLRAQSNLASRGAMNALIPSAQEQQRQYDIANQSATNLQNQTTLAGRQQGINELAPGMDLLGTLIQMANTSKGTTTTQTGDSVSNASTKKSWF